MLIYLSAMTQRAMYFYCDVFPKAKLNILLAYDGNENYHRLVDKYGDNIDSLILDSGAFGKHSREQKGLEVFYNKYGYARYLRNHHSKYDIYVNFDEDFTKSGFEINYQNQLFLESLGLNPMPVIHNYDVNSQEVQFYLNCGKYNLVSFGFSEDKTIANIKTLAHAFHDAGIDVHLLGRTFFKSLAFAPISLCDSSSWAVATKYHYGFWWNPYILAPDKTAIINFPEREKGSPKHNLDIHPFRAEYLSFARNTFGYTYHDLVHSVYRNYFRNVMNMFFYQQVQESVTKIHKQLGFKTEV